MCFVENTIDCHFELPPCFLRIEPAVGRLVFNRFLRFAMLRIASVEMTCVLFYRALSMTNNYALAPIKSVNPAASYFDC